MAMSQYIATPSNVIINRLTYVVSATVQHCMTHRPMPGTHGRNCSYVIFDQTL